MGTVVHLLLQVGWFLVWMTAVAGAVLQILRGRALAGAALGLAGIGGLILMALPSVTDLVRPALMDALGLDIGLALIHLVYLAGDTAVLVLLLAGATVSRPAPEPVDDDA